MKGTILTDCCKAALNGPENFIIFRQDDSSERRRRLRRRKAEDG